MNLNKYLVLLNIIFFFGCDTTPKQEKEEVQNFAPDSVLKFVVKTKEETNITFANVVKESKNLNYFNFSYMYAGAGVAVGDINNDGLSDIFFVGNGVENKLYLNRGNFKFKDISVNANIEGKDKPRWSTGVTMADVNGDGFLDIYVCISGPSPDRRNLLYLNNGDLTFTEKAAVFGLNDEGYSNQATFFDFDRDGDLDMYLASYPPSDFQSPNPYYVEKLKTATEEESDQLYENVGNSNFINVTHEAGIHNFGLSLNASVSDFNNDGWYDIYVSNDFNSPDFLYINQKNGKFKNEITCYTNHTSNFGMGCDAADFNNDGYIDLMQADMMSTSNFGKKRNMSAMSPEYFYEAVDLGLHYQYMRNSLQMNNGNGSFSDIAEIAGVANTDWSWSTLFVDLNNDGWKDIFVTNGMRRSVNNKDYELKIASMIEAGLVTPEKQHLLLQNMPVEPVSNKVFLNNGDLTFTSDIDPQGLSYYGFTHGAAYADFDLDGDLDMVVNNLDRMSMIVENQTQKNKSLRIMLKGDGENTFGIGAKVKLIKGSHTQYQELMPTRGYLSSVEPILHFGMGAVEKVDTLKVTWPNGKVQVLTDVSSDKVLELKETDAQFLEETPVKNEYLFTEVTEKIGLNFRHKENDFDDFKKQLLLPHQLSKLGPAFITGDVNGDGLADAFVGGASGQASELYLQNKNGKFEQKNQKTFDNDRNHEDMGATLLDADGDGDLDLYVVSGGNEYTSESDYYADRLYANDGKGNFLKSIGAIPKIKTSGSNVEPFDYDKDGDMDLFVGGRLSPWEYPKPASSVILRNDKGKFTNVTDEIAPELTNIGLVTDAVWSDYNGDGEIDLLLTGEWMPITVFEQKSGKFKKNKSLASLKNSEGWWCSIVAADLDNDGDDDYIAGNLGLNYKYKANQSHPFEVYYADFDQNGTKDLALGYYENKTLYPVRGRQCSAEQIPSLKAKFKSYDAFAKASFSEVYDISNTSDALHLTAKNFTSSILINEGNGVFAVQPLPNLAQLSAINGIVVKDFDKDGVKDIVVAGNLFSSEVETPRNDAGTGLFMKGQISDNKYRVIPIHQSGLNFRKDLKSLSFMESGARELLIGVNNNDILEVFEYIE